MLATGYLLVATNVIHFQEISCSCLIKMSNNNVLNVLNEDKKVDEENAMKMTKTANMPVRVKTPLHSTWVVRHYENNPHQNWIENHEEIGSVSTVKDFWEMCSTKIQASKLTNGHAYSFFKKGIFPMWEDDANMHGGRWIITLDVRRRDFDLDGLWYNTLHYLISDDFLCKEEICGVIVTVKRRVDRISVWTANANRRVQVLDIGYKLKEILNLGPTFKIDYQSHADTIGKNPSFKSFVYYTI